MSTYISTFFKEDTDGPRAEVYLEETGYTIRYYDMSGSLFRTEEFTGKSLHYVEDAAENWALGIKNLNG